MRNICLVLMLLISSLARAQDTTNNNQLPVYPAFFTRIDKSILHLEAQVKRQKIKFLKRLGRVERELSRWMPGILTGNNKIQKFSRPYDAFGDTLGTAMAFLLKFPKVHDFAAGSLGKIFSLSHNLDSSFSLLHSLQSARVKLSALSNTFPQLTNRLKKFDRCTNLYAARLSVYRSIINDPQKNYSRALAMVCRLPAFQPFFKEHSQLADLFAKGIHDSGVLNNLQTRLSITTLLNGRMAVGGTGAVRNAGGDLALAHASLTKLQAKLSGAKNNLEIPNNMPSSQQAKTFFKRIELGTNLQIQYVRQFPARADIAFSLAYKIDDKSRVGACIVYRFGLGRSWHDIHLSQEGTGLRSFADLKLKRSIFITAGFEQNHFTSLPSPSSSKGEKSWKASGLLGLTRKFLVTKKVRGQAQLLWDFLSYRHQPVSQPVLYRIGYYLK